MIRIFGRALKKHSNLKTNPFRQNRMKQIKVRNTNSSYNFFLYYTKNFPNKKMTEQHSSTNKKGDLFILIKLSKTLKRFNT